MPVVSSAFDLSSGSQYCLPAATLSALGVFEDGPSDGGKKNLKKQSVLAPSIFAQMRGSQCSKTAISACGASKTHFIKRKPSAFCLSRGALSGDI